MDREPAIDALLVLDAQRGLAPAFETLARRWTERLWRHARRLTGRDDAAWDVVQEAWLAIVRGLRRLDDSSGFGPWAYRIVTHKSADWQRGEIRRTRLARECAARARPPGPERPDETASRREIHAALDRLGGAPRAVLALHYLEGWGIDEIGAALDVPAGTVKSRLFHARQELRRLLEEASRERSIR